VSSELASALVGVLGLVVTACMTWVLSNDRRITRLEERTEQLQRALHSMPKRRTDEENGG
jgi:type II secretory pathway component PulJ